MYWSDFRTAFDDAKRTMAQADDVAAQMARMLAGRLRKCDADTLAHFKNELQKFDARSKVWRE